MFLFTRRHTYHFQVPKEELKRRLVGAHVRIHDLDFEVMERESKLTIIPHAEQVNAIKTLPITSVVMTGEGDNTRAVVTSKMRQLDSGGPILLLTFSTFMIIAAGVLLMMKQEANIAFTLLGIAASILTIFSIRMQTGYFDYVRKVRGYVKSKAVPQLSGSMPLMHA
jgi:hypothetical protein